MLKIAPGELLDKYSILLIKMGRIKDPEKLVNVKAELDYVGETMLGHISDAQQQTIQPHWDELLRINRELWDVEDKLREHEANQDFGDEFIQLARSVYKLNDKRSELKRNINIELGSPFIEEKSYKEY